MNHRILISSFIAGIALLAAPAAHAEEAWYEPLVRTLHGFFGHEPVQYQYDHRMVRAAEIAISRAHPRQTGNCWKYVKNALVDADVISKRPESPWAKQAGDELCDKFGFTKLPVSDPYDAPVGAVVVYGGTDAGHVELRSDSGFVSDFISRTPYPRPLIGVYVKP
jgi:hypothetical protein